MGNWRTVNVRGTFQPTELEAARVHLTPDEAWENFGPLSITDGLASLGDWPAAEVDVAGNLSERDYSVEDVADALQKMLVVAPSMRLKVHCGGDWESTQCIATITVFESSVSIGDPEVPAVREPSMAVAMDRLFKAISKD